MAGPGKPGRKKIEIDIRKVKRLASRGLSEEQIALCLGIGYATLRRRKAESELFEQALKEGQAKGIAEVTNALFEQATSGSTAAACFYLKNRGDKVGGERWADKQEITGEAGLPFTIQIVKHGKDN